MWRIIDIELGAGAGHFFGVVFLERHLWIRPKNEFKFDRKTGVQVEHENKISSLARKEVQVWIDKTRSQVGQGILIQPLDT